MLWDFAMWHDDVATQRNPMELVKVEVLNETEATTAQPDGG